MSTSTPTTEHVSAPVIVVKASNPVLTLVTALIVGLGAFFGGMHFERSKRADYTVRVIGVPEQITVVGAPDNITVAGIPEHIQVSGGVQGIPDSITFKGTSLEGILPKGVDVHTAATAVIDNRHMLAVTPQGSVYMIYFKESSLAPGTGMGTWEVWKAAGP